MQPQTTADEYLKSAKGHHAAFKILWHHAGNEKDGFNVIYYPLYNLLGFSFELYLKSYLCAIGLGSDILSRRPFGHSLNSIYRKCVECGFCVSSEDYGDTDVEGYRLAFERFLLEVDKNHSSYTVRYPSVEHPTFYFLDGKPADALFSMLLRLETLMDWFVVHKTLPVNE